MFFFSYCFVLLRVSSVTSGLDTTSSGISSAGLTKISQGSECIGDGIEEGVRSLLICFPSSLFGLCWSSLEELTSKFESTQFVSTL